MGDPYRFKVVVVGDAFVGKSCLLHRLRYGTMPRGGYVNTIGCEFFSFAADTEAGEAVLSIWDTAGHESFRAFTPSFLRNAHACLVCADLSKASSSVADLDWWANEARRHSDQVSLIVVGTKADLPPAPDSAEELGHLAGSISAVLHRTTSSVTGEGVRALFHDVAAHLLAKHPKRPVERPHRLPRRQSPERGSASVRADPLFFTRGPRGTRGGSDGRRGRRWLASGCRATRRGPSSTPSGRRGSGRGWR